MAIKHLNWRGLFTFGFAVILSGCSTIVSKQPLTPSKAPQKAWHDYQQTLQDLQSWQASGVIGVIIDQQGESANFIWKQDHTKFWLQLYGPLGLGATTFSGDDSGVVIKKSNGDTKHAKTLQSLMQEELGWQIPLKGLYYWARGLYDPTATYQLQLNQYGLAQSIDQQGWQITYKNYALFARKYPLPQKIILRYNTLKLTAVIKAWTFNITIPTP
ncbi:lipoprotein insertase outer membrane protein LolB [Facilibium subflavum]|uniref:lipoprotein insertase outer membrane protein LolB n=1 Tax=Facilibium subflavum TaxID=2219058 RepID=UPI0013C33A56|nr:lipoprotein insertase outer membrane protein LolB [Facilibium subflavum]